MATAMTLNILSKEQQEQNDAAEKIQAIKRGQDARAKVELDKAINASPVWAAVKAGDAAKLASIAASGSNNLGLGSAESGTPLQAAVAAAQYECAKVLVSSDSALGMPATELKVWQKIQEDQKPSVDEEGNEVDPKDTSDPEYQAELAAALLPSLDPKEAGFVVKAIAKIGFYVGGRAELAEVDKEFDGHVGAKAGYGVSLSPGGDVYAGMYGGAAGVYNGVGALRTKAGTAYAGDWLDGKRHGFGVMSYVDGGKYAGKWAYGKRHGSGTFTYANKDTYAGQWHAGDKHGEGKYTAASEGCVYEGTWRFGKLVKSKVVMLTAESAAYYGSFDKFGRPTEAGAFAFGNGVTLSGMHFAPPVDEAEGDEPPPVLPATWAGETLGSVEATTDSAFKAAFLVVKPVQNVVICGAPASGKGTQCERIVEKLGLVHVSTGDVLRAAAEDGDNEDGQIAKEKMEAGELVPDDLIVRLVVQKLNDPAVREKGWLLDGFPRTAAQAAAMEQNFLIPTKCILLNVPEEVLKERVLGRRSDPETGTIYHMTTKPPYKLDEEGNPVKEVNEETGEETLVLDQEIVDRLVTRADDTEEALVKRLEMFRENRDAVAAAFASIAVEVDGNRAPDVIAEEIGTTLG